MIPAPVPYHTIARRWLARAFALSAFGFLAFAPQASATYCPAGTDYVTDYCVNAALFQTLVLQDQPEAYYRLNDPTGSETMTDSSGNNHHGQYKNDQDSGPVGITAADNDIARDFFGAGGYGFVNGIPAPGPDNSYTNYTMEIWFNQVDTDSDPVIHDDAMLMQDGGGGSLYIKSNTIRFRNGPNDEISAPLPCDDGEWCMVAGERSGAHIYLWVRKSPAAPTFFNPTPDASGLSTYRPGGSPTFYVGYGEYAPWFNGSLDEAIYYKHAVSATRLGYHFYADPAPDNLGNSARHRGHSGGGKSPGAGGSQKAKLARAKANVKRLTKLVKKAQVWLYSLKRHHAKPKAIKKARAHLKVLNRQLKAAKHKVKQLS